MNPQDLSNTPLVQVAQILYKVIETTEDPAALKVLSTITYNLQPLLDQELVNGVGRLLDLWVGLKLDAPEMGATYGDGIKVSYPEVFGDTK